MIKETVSKFVLNDATTVVDLKKSQGSWLVDVNGKRYLDCFSQYSSQPIGWNHPKLLANRERLMDVVFHKVSNPDTLCSQYGDFLEGFASITPDFKHYFFIEGGTLAVENALKAAFDWKAHKMGIATDVEINKLNVLHLNEAFHGRSGYSLSLTNSSYSDIKTRLFPKFRWGRITNPKIHFPINEQKVANLEKMSIQYAESYLTKGNVAAIILEPIQGEGGDNHFRKEYFLKLRELADIYQALLIFDEVQTGMGMTGKWWAYEHFGVTPDILVFGKKVQTCGICAGDRLDEIGNNVFRTLYRINSTWGGNIVDMVRGTIIIEIMKEDSLVENAKECGDYFLDKLRELGFENARGRGLMVAFDLEDANKRDLFIKKLGEKVLAIKSGSKSIRFRPALTINKEEIDFLINAIKEVKV